MGPGTKLSFPGNSRLSMWEMDRTLRTIPVKIVTIENMAAVWTTSPHLMLLLPLRLAGLNNATIHWKNKTVTIPRITD